MSRLFVLCMMWIIEEEKEYLDVSVVMLFVVFESEIQFRTVLDGEVV